MINKGTLPYCAATAELLTKSKRELIRNFFLNSSKRKYFFYFDLFLRK